MAECLEVRVPLAEVEDGYLRRGGHGQAGVRVLHGGPDVGANGEGGRLLDARLTADAAEEAPRCGEGGSASSSFRGGERVPLPEVGQVWEILSEFYRAQRRWLFVCQNRCRTTQCGE